MKVIIARRLGLEAERVGPTPMPLWARPRARRPARCRRRATRWRGASRSRSRPGAQHLGAFRASTCRSRRCSISGAARLRSDRSSTRFAASPTTCHRGGATARQRGADRRALRRATFAQSIVLHKLEVAFAALIGALFFSEYPALVGWIGGRRLHRRRACAINLGRGRRSGRLAPRLPPDAGAALAIASGLLVVFASFFSRTPTPRFVLVNPRVGTRPLRGRRLHALPHDLARGRDPDRLAAARRARARCEAGRATCAACPGSAPRASAAASAGTGRTRSPWSPT